MPLPCSSWLMLFGVECCALQSGKSWLCGSGYYLAVSVSNGWATDQLIFWHLKILFFFTIQRSSALLVRLISLFFFPTWSLEAAHHRALIKALWPRKKKIFQKYPLKIMSSLDTDLNSFNNFCHFNLESPVGSPLGPWPKQAFPGTCVSRRWHCVFDSGDGVHEQQAASAEHLLLEEEGWDAVAFWLKAAFWRWLLSSSCKLLWVSYWKCYCVWTLPASCLGSRAVADALCRKGASLFGLLNPLKELWEKIVGRRLLSLPVTMVMSLTSRPETGNPTQLCLNCHLMWVVK